MIYAFIKENSEYVSKEEQAKAIKNYIKSKELIIDRYILDNYKSKYCEMYNLKKGYGTGSYIFNLKAGDVLICYNFYVLAYSYKTVMFLLKTALEKGARVFNIKDDIELNTIHLETLNIIYNLQCFFNEQREEKTLKPGWSRYKLAPYKDEIKELIRQGTPMRQIIEKYKTTYTTLSTFINRNPELFNIYKTTNPYFGLHKKTKWIDKRPLLREQVTRYIRKAKASIIPKSKLLLLEKLENEKTM